MGINSKSEQIGKQNRELQNRGWGALDSLGDFLVYWRWYRNVKYVELKLFFKSKTENTVYKTHFVYAK